MSQDALNICVLAVDDHPLLGEGIAALLADGTDIALVGEAADGREGVERFRTLRPDVTWMDLQMPNLNRAKFPDAHIVVLTTYTGDVQVPLALKTGASGYFAEDRDSHGTAHHDVHAGRKVRSPEVTFADLAGCSAPDRVRAPVVICGA